MSEAPLPPDPATVERQRVHDLRNALNSAGLCVHAAEQLLRAGNADKAIDSLGRASNCLERARALLFPSADAA